MAKDNTCFYCNNEALASCHTCKKNICKEHSYKIKHSIKCPKCARHDQQVGRIMKYSLVLVLIIVLIVVVQLKP